MSVPEGYGLYFIAWVPHGELLQKLEEVKQEFAREYHVRRALKSPPHITLQMPFRWALKREAVLVESLNSIRSNPFQLNLNGFGAFPPKVIFIKPEESPELRILYLEIQQRMRSLGVQKSSYQDRGFSPHLTVIYGDVKKQVFLEAWKKNKSREFKGTQKVNTVSLLKHDGKMWRVFKKGLLPVTD